MKRKVGEMVLVVEFRLFRLDDQKELSMKICTRAKPLGKAVWGRQQSTMSEKNMCLENKES